MIERRAEPLKCSSWTVDQVAAVDLGFEAFDDLDRQLGPEPEQDWWLRAAMARYSAQEFAGRPNRGSAWPDYSAPSRKGRTS